MLKSCMLKSFILLVGTLCVVNANCIWYGECGPSQNDGRYNCKYQGEARPLGPDPELNNVFKDLCPHLFNGVNETSTCCARDQIERINKDMSLPHQLMSRCPACFRNFKAFLCDFSCNPKQSEFLLVTQEQPYVPDTNEIKKISDNSAQMEIVRLTYHATNQYVENMFNSCQ